MNTNTSTPATSSASSSQVEKDITNQQLMSKLLELEKKIEEVEKKLTTPLIS